MMQSVKKEVLSKKEQSSQKKHPRESINVHSKIQNDISFRDNSKSISEASELSKKQLESEIELRKANELADTLLSKKQLQSTPYGHLK